MQITLWQIEVDIHGRYFGGSSREKRTSVHEGVETASVLIDNLRLNPEHRIDTRFDGIARVVL